MGSVQIVGIFYPMWGVGGLFFMQCRSAKILTLLLHKCVMFVLVILSITNVCFAVSFNQPLEIVSSKFHFVPVFWRRMFQLVK